ncbi:Protein-arginine deiminase type-4 [Paramyrothecium foliicola]|nr:Protein-arginine deiminase type-4 [Paramyrothecium foliicola]
MKVFGSYIGLTAISIAGKPSYVDGNLLTSEGLFSVASAFTATILADTNRDGVIDNLDFEEKKIWSSSRGALFLANIVDTDKRCSSQITRDTADIALDFCHDAADDILRNPRYIAPLVTQPISGLNPKAQGSIYVAEPSAAAKVRIFHKGVNGSWTFVTAEHIFGAAELEKGLELGIDARDVRRPGGWDGRATVRFTVSNGSEGTSDDAVALRVAPVLTHNHAQAAERIFITTIATSPHEQFVRELHRNVDSIARVQEMRDAGEYWTQDFFETGYSSIPGPNGPVVVRILLRSAQFYRSAGRTIFSELRDGNTGAVSTGNGGIAADSTGNLETIPPYTHNGKAYPAGRVIYSPQWGVIPKILPFLEAQEVQAPLGLDAEWLSVGHVDEFLQFVPVDSKRGWVLMVDDPLKGLALLEKAVADGNGDQRAFSRPNFPYDSYDGGKCVPTLTIKQVLGLNDFAAANKLAAERINTNIEVLKQETGISDDEILRLPATFYNQNPVCDIWRSRFASAPTRPGQLNIVEAATPPRNVIRRQNEGSFDKTIRAFHPAIINGVVLTNSTVLAPNPWGPVIDGRDILLAEAEDIYAKAGYKVIWQDDWFSFHVRLGEIHCGTNTWRSTGGAWW